VARKYWLCPKCRTRHQRIIQRCECGGKRPAPRVPKHARTLRDDSYEVYNQVNAEIHGVTDESCAICSKPRSQERRHDRDHDHTTGKPRGLLCWRCNRNLPRDVDAEWLEKAHGYLSRVDEHYRKQAA